MTNRIRAEKLIRLISDDSAEYMRLRRRVISLPEAERTRLELNAGDFLEELKKVLLGARF